MKLDIKAAIFDMDGTIIDSMWIWDKIDKDYLKKRNLEVPQDLKGDIEHLSFDGTAQYFKTRFHLSDSISEIKNEWMDMAYKEYSTRIPLKPGVKNFLQLLKSMNIKIGLATSNCHLLIEAALKSNNIYHYFDTITTTDEVSRGKNYPDVYLLAASRLGVNPNDCIVFEDILPAIEGAKSAGMKVIGVYDECAKTQKQDIVKLVDHYIENYSELSNII